MMVWVFAAAVTGLTGMALVVLPPEALARFFCADAKRFVTTGTGTGIGGETVAASITVLVFPGGVGR